MTHDEIRESIPGYALHALAPEEVRDVEAHLADCAECRRELAVFEEAASTLAAGFEPHEPPAMLRRQVLDAVRPRGRAVRLGRGWATALAAAAAVIIALAGIAVSLEQRLTALATRTASEAQALALLADPASRVVTLSGSAAGSVRFVFDPATGRGALVATGLRDPGPDLVYQLWLVAGAAPRSAGVFRPTSGTPVIVAVGADFPRYQAVAISIEHGPSGATRPSASPVLVGKLGGG
ncbi:MAG TPA: anti-sigma factor [bacterium]|nr:anti-sigma factor [bacterium]